MSYQPVSYRLDIAAQADSTLLCRVCGLLASLGLVPESFLSRCDGAGQATLVIVLADATARQADLLQRKLMQMTQVTAVECASCPLSIR